MSVSDQICVTVSRPRSHFILILAQDLGFWDPSEESRVEALRDIFRRWKLLKNLNGVRLRRRITALQRAGFAEGVLAHRLWLPQSTDTRRFWDGEELDLQAYRYHRLRDDYDRNDNDRD